MDREQQIKQVADRIHQHSYGPLTEHRSYHSCACSHQAVALVDVARILDLANGHETDLFGLVDSYLDEGHMRVLRERVSTERTGCGCSGHWMPGVRHIVACCDQPHIDQMMFTSVVTSEGIQSYSDVVKGTSEGMVCYCDTITGGAQVRKETCPVHGEAVRQALSLVYPTQQESTASCTCSAYEVAEDCLIHGSHNHV